jgi:hypothetical protein
MVFLRQASHELNYHSMLIDAYYIFDLYKIRDKNLELIKYFFRLKMHNFFSFRGKMY